MQAHAADARAAFPLQDFEVVDVDAVAEAPDALARPLARGDAATGRGGVERGEERLLAREPVGLCAVGEAAALEQALDPTRHLGGDAGDLGVPRRREDVGAQEALQRAGVDAVEHERAEVDVQVHAHAMRAEEGDRSFADFGGRKQPADGPGRPDTAPADPAIPDAAASFERYCDEDTSISADLLAGGMVAQARIELATPAFSVRCSTN